MKLVVIFGPHAVGKMTVGQALAAQTGLRLFHNHMTIDVVSDLFENMPGERSRLTQLFREAGCHSLHFSGVPGHLILVATKEGVTNEA